MYCAKSDKDATYYNLIFHGGSVFYYYWGRFHYSNKTSVFLGALVGRFCSVVKQYVSLWNRGTIPMLKHCGDDRE